MEKFVSDSFVKKTINKYPKPMNELGEFVFYRTYSRWLPKEKRREYWHETVQRAVNYNIGLVYKHLKKIGFKPNTNELREEAEILFLNKYLLKQFVSGRTMWIGGSENGVAEKYPMANFNCSFINIKSWNDLGDLFYLLMVGTGVGFKATKEMAKKLSPIRTNTKLISSKYNPLLKNERIERTNFIIHDNGYAKIYVGDSKEGWVEALRLYFEILTKKEYEFIHTVKINFNSIRPKGERLNTFGGTASGHESLKEMFEGINKVLKNHIDPSLKPIEADSKGYGKVRPIHILDIGNLIGANVVVGGVRRSAEIFLFDEDDYEVMLAKYGINGFWTEEQLKHHREVGKLLGKNKPSWFDEIIKIGNGRFELDHRRMSNNSVAFNKKPTKEYLNLLFTIMQSEGEPAFINLEEAKRRRPNAEGLNPCSEVLLDSYGLCNLTTINLVAFAKRDEKGNNYLDVNELIEAQKLSTRIGIRMTLADLELPHWNEIQKRDRLIGTSLTGVKDTLAILSYSEEDERALLEILGNTARIEAERYSKELRIPTPLLVTTVKPEGTISQLAGGVSSGLHWSHSPYYIRRIRINANDPLVKVSIKLGWNVNPEVGTKGETFEEQMQNARTLVIDFPVSSGATETKDDVSAKQQLETYFRFQKYYTDHNSSNTITVRPNEWNEVEHIIWDNWDDFVGVSFLQLDGGTYQLAPYESTTKEQYEELKTKMKPFDVNLLHEIEKEETDSDLENIESCESGICPVR